MVNPYYSEDNHTIYLGNCLEIMKEFPDKSFDLCLTDPPYNTGITARSSSRLKNFFEDDYTDEDYLKLVRETANQMFRLLKDDSPIYIFMNWKKLGLWIEELSAAGFSIKNCIVWDKVVHGMNYTNYAYTHEFIIYGCKGSYRPNNRDGNKYYKDIWHIKRDMGKKLDDNVHETVKPLSVVSLPILHGTLKDSLILDPFMGSGTTLVAAKMLGRRSVGIEISQRYCRVAVNRLRQEVLF